MTDTIFIGIAGGTGSGKTTLTEHIKKRFGDAVGVIYHDNYYKDQSGMPFEVRCRQNYDHPDAFETDLMVRHLKALKAGGRAMLAPTGGCVFRKIDFPLRPLPPDMARNALHNHVQGHQVVAALQNDDVREALGGLNELLVHGLDRGEVLLHHRIQIPPPLLHVPEDAAENAHVRLLAPYTNPAKIHLPL